MTTKFQADLLTRYQAFRRDAPTVAGQVKRNAPTLIGAVLFLAGVAAVLWWFEARVGAGVALGFLAATLFHSLGAYVRTRDIWPLVERITDWSEVDRLRGG